MDNVKENAPNPPNDTFSLVLGNYNIKLQAKEDHITIQAENPVLLRFYGKKLSNTDLEELSSGLLSTPRDLLDAFTSVKEYTNSNVSLKMDENAVITMSYDLKVGIKTKTISFKIQLENEAVEPLEVAVRCVKYIEENTHDSLPPMTGVLAKTLSQVIEHNKALQHQLEEVMKRMAGLEAKIGL